jgi:hypothetical protein
MTNIHPEPAQEERRMRPRRGAVLPFTKSDTAGEVCKTHD